MPIFAYRALDARGGTVVGRVRAGDRAGAEDALRRRDIMPVSIAPAGSGGGLLARFHGGQDPVTVFTRDLETLLDAQVPLGRALAMLAETAGTPRAEALAAALLARVRGGASLAEAMAADPETFPPYYRGMVRAGEQSSALAPVLGRIADMLERNAALQAEIAGKLTYPIAVLIMAGATLAILLAFVIPAFRPIFEQGTEIPATTRAVLAASDMARSHGWLIATVLAALAMLAGPLLRRPATRRVVDPLVFRLPVVGEMIVRLETARFARMLGTLVTNGVVLIEGVRIAAGAAGNTALGASMKRVAAGLEAGEGVGHALSGADWLPDRARQLIAVGVESGRLGAMLMKIADIYDAESARAAQRLIGLITPLTTIVLGGLIAMMVWAVMDAVLGAYEQAL